MVLFCRMKVMISYGFCGIMIVFWLIVTITYEGYDIDGSYYTTSSLKDSHKKVGNLQS